MMVSNKQHIEQASIKPTKISTGKYEVEINGTVYVIEKIMIGFWAFYPKSQGKFDWNKNVTTDGQTCPYFSDAKVQLEKAVQAGLL